MAHASALSGYIIIWKGFTNQIPRIKDIKVANEEKRKIWTWCKTTPYSLHKLFHLK
jgi:hypothetical protein